MPVRQAVTRTTFEKVGDNVAANIGFSAAGPRRGKLVKKGNAGIGGMLEGATATHKANIQERLGAQWAPQVTLYAPNAPEAAQTQRNTRIVQSAVGNRDFYMRRAFGQNT